MSGKTILEIQVPSNTEFSVNGGKAYINSTGRVTTRCYKLSNIKATASARNTIDIEGFDARSDFLLTLDAYEAEKLAYAILGAAAIIKKELAPKESKCK